MIRPSMNVTPLIDVLLVLLIIFMVITPLKPSSFKTRVPAKPELLKNEVTLATDTLIVSITQDHALALNSETGLGTVSDPDQLIDRLKTVFENRIKEGNVSATFADDTDRPASDRIERMVFVKAPKNLGYGRVAHVVDAVKIAGAYPISLQIDHLD